ncbi:MAG: DUF3891 family protein [Acidobacteriota bacterium]|jgi:hypothetical protein
MIVVPEGDRLRMITQADHAHLAGEIVSLWRADGLPGNPHRGDVIFAAREHDNGWREADSAPRVDPATGRPHDFLTLPDGPRIEIWRRGVERHCLNGPERPYAALLICRHAEVLHSGRRGEPRWDEQLFEPLEELITWLLEETGTAPESLSADAAHVALGDRISLAACRGSTEPFVTAGTRGRFADGTVYLSPFPLAGATTFRVRCRTISDRSYADAVDLIGELAAARWEEIRIRLAPETEPG